MTNYARKQLLITNKRWKRQSIYTIWRIFKTNWVQRKPNLDNVPQIPKNRYGRTYFGHPTFNPFTSGPRFVEDGGNI